MSNELIKLMHGDFVYYVDTQVFARVKTEIMAGFSRNQVSLDSKLVPTQFAEVVYNRRTNDIVKCRWLLSDLIEGRAANVIDWMVVP